MENIHDKNQIFIKYGMNSFGKFKYTLSEKMPFLDKIKLDWQNIFWEYFNNGGSYNIYFYISLIKYLDKSNVDKSIIIEVMKYVAITSLYNRNTIYIELEKNIIGFYRNLNKVKMFVVDSREDISKITDSLLEFDCNHDR